MTNPQLSSEDKISLLALMTFVEEVSNSDLDARYGFRLTGQARLRLERLGLVSSRKDEQLRGKPFVFDLTEKGWRWCRDEMTGAAPQNSAKAYRVLYGVLNCVDRGMTKSGLALDQIFVPPTGKETSPEDVETRIRTAYQDLAKKPGEQVRLRLVRTRLADIPRETVDAALLHLVGQEGVHLEPESRRLNLTEEDTHASIVVGGEPKHLLTIEPS